MAALHWSPGGRCPEAIMERYFNGASCRGFEDAAVRVGSGSCCGWDGRRGPRWHPRRANAISPASMPKIRRPESVGLEISGVRPASASGMHSREVRLQLLRPSAEETELPAASAEVPAASPIEVTSALAAWQPLIQPLNVPVRDEEACISSENSFAASTATQCAPTSQPLSRAAPVTVLLGSEWTDLAANEGMLRVSLVAAADGAALGQVFLTNRVQAQRLRALLSGAHEGGHSIRSTVEFWDGDFAGSAEGALSVKQMGQSSFQISHNFLELSRADSGTRLTFEDVPEMRILIEGASLHAAIVLKPPPT